MTNQDIEFRCIEVRFFRLGVLGSPGLYTLDVASAYHIYQDHPDPCSAADPKLNGFHFSMSTPWRLLLVNLNLTSPPQTHSRRSHQPMLASAILFRKVSTHRSSAIWP